MTILYLITRIVDQPISEEEMHTKWVPGGVRAYVEHNYVSTRDEREQWKFTGQAIYDATFSRSNTQRLMRPAANLAYFCTVAGGSFKLQNPDDTAFTPPSTFRPVDEHSHFHNYPYYNAFTSADRQAAVIEAQESGAWGYFTCSMPSGQNSWWASIPPAIKAEATGDRTGSSWAMPISIRVHETPVDALPPVARAVIFYGQETAMKEAFNSPKCVIRSKQPVLPVSNRPLLPTENRH